MTDQKITTYRLTHLPGAKFVRRPVSIPPKDGALCFIDRGTADVANRPTGAWYRDGRWLDMRALAAQIAATHMITMKVAKFAYDHPHDTRTVASYAKLARAAANQIDTMAGMKGKRRTTRQQISVVHEKHVHQHQHVHVGGAEETKGQPHGTSERTAVPEERSPMPSSQKGGLVVPLKSHAR